MCQTNKLIVELAFSRKIDYSPIKDQNITKEHQKPPL